MVASYLNLTIEFARHLLYLTLFGIVTDLLESLTALKRFLWLKEVQGTREKISLRNWSHTHNSNPLYQQSSLKCWVLVAGCKNASCWLQVWKSNYQISLSTECVTGQFPKNLSIKLLCEAHLARRFL